MQVPQKKFRPYQNEAATAILGSWAKGEHCIAVVATGGGKTMIAAGTSARIQKNGGGRILFLANRNELCVQPLEAFADQLGFEVALEKADSYASLDARVVIGSVQTLTRKARLHRFPKDHFAYIFADEAHMSLAESWKRIFEHFSSAKRCGITATPFRTDGKSLSELFTVEAYRKDLFQLVDDGWLVDPDNVDKLTTAISLAQVRVKRTMDGVDYDVNDAASAIEPYFQEIAKELRAKHSAKKILAFLPLVASSQKFVQACVAEGINAVHIDGNDPQRDEKLELFRQGKISLLSNASLLHTGVDIPCCDCTLNLRPTKSKVLYQQIVGRSTRPEPGLIDGLATVEERKAAIANSSKPKAYILDPMWLTDDYDLVTPAFLIAQSEEEAADMIKAAPATYSLRELHRQVQEEREEAIRRRLERAASFREGTVSAEYFAAASHDHTLVNYRAVYAWETAPATRFSRLLLAKAGVDPDSVTGEGHARAVMAAIYRRRYRKQPEIRALAGAAEHQIENLFNLSIREAAGYV